MKKYLKVFAISFQQEFAYKVNFIMWRVRNVLQIFLVFFLWDTVFINPGRQIFGYDKARILTYIFGLLIVRAFVLSARAGDISGEVARGDLSNYLVKPLDYFKYWFTRDLSSKALNLIFAFFETIILYFILKPPFYLQTNPIYIIGFFISLSIAIFTYFILLLITGSIPLWIPEAAWGVTFLMTAIFVEFLSGALFPLDILPKGLQSAINLTPFPYLIFFPLQVYLGKVSGIVLIKGILVSGFWVVALWIGMKALWKKGLKAYESHGR